MICVSGGIIMKKIKKFATFCLAAFFTFGVATLAASCKKDNDDKSSSASSIDLNAPATAYRFKVVDTNGAPVAGVVIQLCKATCVFSEPTDANGEVFFAGDSGATDYDIHVFTADPNIGTGGTQLSHTGAEKTPNSYNHDVITLTISAN